ncbi:MAG: cyanophycinase [Massilia sp.]|jgi:cyanophycinase|nr:cyanophycinase [Massilia sp.]
MDIIKTERKDQRERKDQGRGHLVIIGGSEDRVEDKEILARFVELSGGADAKIIVITAASKIPADMWAIYDAAFGALGVRDRSAMHLTARAEANDPDNARRILDATGIFMTGGDQKRLLAIIGGSATAGAMHDALLRHGACIGGTSAGASAMSAHMLAEGRAELNPEKGAATLGAGLGLVRRAVIDQHFSERHRLARLLSIVAQNPYLHGLGIDEDTALVITLGDGIEVIGNGSVTLVDGRHLISNVTDAARRDSLELIDVRLHMLPAGKRYRRHDADEYADESADDRGDVPPVPEPLRDLIDILTQTNTHHENH